MKKAVFATISSFVAIVIVTRSDLMLPVLSFLVTGLVPGTNFIVPFWGMMAFYCLLITVIVTFYIEGTILFIKTHRTAQAHKARLPKRRYHTI